MFSIVQNFANKNTIFKKNYHTIAWQVNPNKKNFTHVVHHCKMYNAVVLVLNSKKVVIGLCFDEKNAFSE